MVITVHVRLPVANESDVNGGSTAPDSPPVVSKSRLSPVLRKASINPMMGMGSARCAMGAVELDGKLVVCGKLIAKLVAKEKKWYNNRATCTSWI